MGRLNVCVVDNESERRVKKIDIYTIIREKTNKSAYFTI